MDIKQIKAAINSIITKREEITLIYLYGSFLKTEHFNDIDLGILVDDSFERDLLYEINLALELEKILKVEIDIRILNGLPLKFLYNLLRSSELLLCRDENIRIEFEERIMKEYLDLKYHHDLYEKARELRYIVGNK